MIRFFYLLCLGLVFFASSCQEGHNKHSSLDSFTKELDALDSVKLGQLIFNDVLIPERDRRIIFASLSDTTRPISEAIALVNCVENLPKVYRNHKHLALLTCAMPPFDIYFEESEEHPKDEYGLLAKDSLLDVMTGYAFQKINLHIDELYDNEIVYDCVNHATISSRCIFLDNGEMHQTNVFIWAGLEIHHWKEIDDVIHLTFNDTIEMRLKKDEDYLRPTTKKGLHFRRLKKR